METKLSQAYQHSIEVESIGRVACYLGEFRNKIAIRGNVIHFKSAKLCEQVANMFAVKGIHMPVINIKP
jgi:hypothetical protein